MGMNRILPIWHNRPRMSDWIELFDGKTLGGWKGRHGGGRGGADAEDHKWFVAGGVKLDPADEKLLKPEPGTSVVVNGDDGRTVDLRSELVHGDCELHLEFCIAAKSNSGVYLQGQYEIQILDSFGEAQPGAHSCGALYPRWVDETKTNYEGQPPRVQACKRPGEWQSYDVLFRAPRFDAGGKKIANAVFERVTLNGTVIHEGYAYSGPSRGSWEREDIARGPLRLQGDHGPVAFRNIRIKLLGSQLAEPTGTSVEDSRGTTAGGRA
jgi:hypothetical protein